MWRPKYIKYCLIGKTYKAVIVYFCIYLLSLVIYEYVMVHETCEPEEEDLASLVSIRDVMNRFFTSQTSMSQTNKAMSQP